MAHVEQRLCAQISAGALRCDDVLRALVGSLVAKCDKIQRAKLKNTPVEGTANAMVKRQRLCSSSVEGSVHMVERVAHHPAGEVFQPCHTMEDAAEHHFGSVKSLAGSKSIAGGQSLKAGLLATQLHHLRLLRQQPRHVDQSEARRWNGLPQDKLQKHAVRAFNLACRFESCCSVNKTAEEIAGAFSRWFEEEGRQLLLRFPRVGSQEKPRDDELMEEECASGAEDDELAGVTGAAADPDFQVLQGLELEQTYKAQIVDLQEKILNEPLAGPHPAEEREGPQTVSEPDACSAAALAGPRTVADILKEAGLEAFKPDPADSASRLADFKLHTHRAHVFDLGWFCRVAIAYDRLLKLHRISYYFVVLCYLMLRVFLCLSMILFVSPRFAMFRNFAPKTWMNVE